MPAHDLSYDFEDFGLDEAGLIDKYGNAGHPEYTIEQWRNGPCDQDDQNGYWDWVQQQIAKDDEAIPSFAD